MSAGLGPPEAAVGRRMRALVVEDSPEFLDLVAGQLRDEGFEVDTAREGRTGLDLARSRDPDLIVLDLGLPDGDGVEVCRKLRSFSQAYIVILTGRDEEVDKLIGLSVGADDYVTKPFSPRELMARVRALLRRPRAFAAQPGPRSFGELVIDAGTREVLIGERKVELTRTEFDLLEVLSSKPNTVFTRSKLLEAVWGPDWFGDDHVLDVCVSSLRRKLDDDPRAPRFIGTVRGVGYRFLGVD